MGLSERPISFNIPSTDATCSKRLECDTSTTCRMRSASFASSKVARKAAIRVVGNFCMNPTVSVTNTTLSSPKCNRRVTGSRVENSLSSERTSEEVSLFNKVLFPALVYPTSATTKAFDDRLLSLYLDLCWRIFSISFLSF